MKDWFLRPFVLYPSRRRLLKRLLAIYGVCVMLVAWYLWVRPFTSMWILVAGFGFVWLTGFVATLHLRVLGMPPAEGMEETNESDEGRVWMVFYIWKDRKVHIWLPGDERRLIIAIAPLPLSIVFILFDGMFLFVHSLF